MPLAWKLGRCEAPEAADTADLRIEAEKAGGGERVMVPSPREVPRSGAGNV